MSAGDEWANDGPTGGNCFGVVVATAVIVFALVATVIGGVRRG